MAYKVLMFPVLLNKLNATLQYCVCGIHIYAKIDIPILFTTPTTSFHRPCITTMILFSLLALYSTCFKFTCFKFSFFELKV